MEQTQRSEMVAFELQTAATNQKKADAIQNRATV
jgi:hypothetical protein